MSYAEAAAASRSPSASDKLPKPVDVESSEAESESAAEKAKDYVDQTSKEFYDAADNASRDVQRFGVNASKEAQNLGNKANKAAHKATKDAKKVRKAISDEAEELQNQIKNNSAVQKGIAFVKQQVTNVSDFWSKTFSKENIEALSTELQNPVVLGQLAVIGAGATAGWYVYAERARINASNKFVVALHASIITGLILADFYTFQKLYPKYKKA